MEGENRKDGSLLFFVNCLNRGRSLVFSMRGDSCESGDVLVFQVRGFFTWVFFEVFLEVIFFYQRIELLTVPLLGALNEFWFTKFCV